VNSSSSSNSSSSPGDLGFGKDKLPDFFDLLGQDQVVFADRAGLDVLVDELHHAGRRHGLLLDTEVPVLDESYELLAIHRFFRGLSLWRRPFPRWGRVCGTIY
jgi:hypothetical protein